MRIKSNTYAGNVSKRGKVKPSLVSSFYLYSLDNNFIEKG